MTHQTIGTGIDHPMAFLSGDGIRPKSAEMNSRPPGEKATGQCQHREQVGSGRANLPKWLLSQHFRGPWREQDGANQNGNAVCPRIPGPDMLLGSAGKE